MFPWSSVWEAASVETGEELREAMAFCQVGTIAPGGCLHSPEILLIWEIPLCTELEHSAAGSAGTRAAPQGRFY